MKIYQHQAWGEGEREYISTSVVQPSEHMSSSLGNHRPEDITRS